MYADKKIVLKLWDHINLANTQYLSFYQEEDKLRKKLYPGLDKKISTLNTKIKKMNRDVSKVTKNYNDIISNMIAIVSIFVAISFVMFGGMSLLNGLFDFSKMNYVPVTELLCLGAMFGIIMLAIIYAFMYFVLRITDKEINGHKFLNCIIVAVIIVLIIICFCTFDYWGKNPSINIYDNDIVETE